MKKNYKGLDVLRGLGIFVLLIMHTAFYHFDGLYDLDLNNPPLIVTLIGLMLMFAGVFAMISGLVHTHQHFRKIQETQLPIKTTLQHNLRSGVFILLIAYLYFIFTGPGVVNMAERFMNNSILVELFASGKLIGTNLERVLYIDSLVMIGMNILLLGLFYRFQHAFFKTIQPLFYLFSGLGFFALSLIRIPLYNLYLTALDQGNMILVFALNWFVNKNNPIFPYLSFALFGAWMATLLIKHDFKEVVKRVLPVGILLFVSGIVLYITLPDTMLERAIDPVWFALMMAQNGLFMLLILLFLKVYDTHPLKPLNGVSTFLKRFGVAGLSIFFIESVISTLIFSLLKLFIPSLSLSIPEALLFGLVLALLWGGILMLWERHGYKYGIEYYYTRFLKPTGGSNKEDKLLETLL